MLLFSMLAVVVVTIVFMVVVPYIVNINARIWAMQAAERCEEQNEEHVDTTPTLITPVE